MNDDSMITLDADDRLTIQTAVHGVMNLVLTADPGVISSTRGGIAAGKAMSSATGLVGHVLAEKSKVKLDGSSTAEIADQVFPALTGSMHLLNAKDPAEADNFRRLIDTIMQSVVVGGPKPAEAEMIRKINDALDA
ncbi:hypothetical protein [Streptomyces sp. GbtcB6]|uniref:hypothetical protein n=1 Tax=Streptomyces sp. GbtcB6 TaxID=2824751 RepID=UPI001C304515|nr:hypothetical protein [Streptomyces sp. GbtcB6]